MLCIPAATYHAFVYMSKAFAGNALWQRYGAPVYSWLMSKQVSTPENAFDNSICASPRPL